MNLPNVELTSPSALVALLAMEAVDGNQDWGLHIHDVPLALIKRFAVRAVHLGAAVRPTVEQGTIIDFGSGSVTLWPEGDDTA